MTEQTCSNCAFFVQDDRGSACNAFHPPDDRPIDCVDWELKEPEALDHAQQMLTREHIGDFGSLRQRR